jgi:hypothetical protein
MTFAEATRSGMSIGRCWPCDRLTYTTRKAARRARGRIPPDGRALAAYPCPHGTGWHLGRLPRVVNARDVLRQAPDSSMVSGGAEVPSDTMSQQVSGGW